MARAAHRRQRLKRPQSASGNHDGCTVSRCVKQCRALSCGLWSRDFCSRASSCSLRSIRSNLHGRCPAGHTWASLISSGPKADVAGVVWTVRFGAVHSFGEQRGKRAEIALPCLTPSPKLCHERPGKAGLFSPGIWVRRMFGSGVVAERRDLRSDILRFRGFKGRSGSTQPEPKQTYIEHQQWLA